MKRYQLHIQSVLIKSPITQQLSLLPTQQTSLKASLTMAVDPLQLDTPIDPLPAHPVSIFSALLWITGFLLFFVSFLLAPLAILGLFLVGYTAWTRSRHVKQTGGNAEEDQ